MSALQAAGLWSGLLILILIALSLRTMLGRWKHRVSLGDGADGQMTVLARGFGNAAEYVPVMIGALILLALLGTGTLAIHALGGAFLVGRLIHPIGIRTPAPNLLRAAGMMRTWLPLIGAAGLILLAALRPI